ncbi:MAG: carbon-nitrogen hydrolase family protein [Armatimonadota bacterium]
MARYVTVSSIAWNAAPGQSAAEALPEAGALLRQAAQSQPDLVIFPEIFLLCGKRGNTWEMAESLPGPTTDYFAALAREFQTNLVIPMLVEEEGRRYNSAVVLDRRGEIVGHYDKVYPTIGELENGISPGSGPKVHQLDFGRIGHAICFDINFPHQAEEMQAMDVDIICFHAMFTGGQLLNHWALTTGAYQLSSYIEDSRLIDMTGIDIKSIGRRYEQYSLWKMPPILTARLNLDRRLFHVDYNAANYDGKHGGIHRLLAECAGMVTIDHNYPASVIAIGALDGVSLQELIEQYNLEPRNTFFQRALQAVGDARPCGVD